MPRRLSLALAALPLLLAFAVHAHADVKPHALFSDGMVLQQGMKAPVWGQADAGEEVSVRIQGKEAKATADGDGRWKAELPPLEPGGPFELVIQGKNELKLKDVLVGEVWVCSGQSNMEWPVAASKDPKGTVAACRNPSIRLFKAPRVAKFEVQTELKGKWTACDEANVPSFSAVGYFFGRDLQKARNVPVGLIQSAWGGTPAEAWTTAEFLEKTPELRPMWERHVAAVKNYRENEKQLWEDYRAKLKEWQEKNQPPKPEGAEAQAKTKTPPAKPPFKAPEDPARSAWGPNQLYAGMIHPLVPFAIRGAIWYQGESNAGRAYEYRTLMPKLIESWRAAWGQGDFPFLMVQLAPFGKNGDADTWPELREAQLLTAQHTPRVGMAVITDVGDQNDIHPKDKETVGARLALAARAIAYGESIVASGPVYESVSFENGKATLRFTQVGGGLTAKDGELRGFTVCGQNKKFMPAKARIEGATVIVECPDVPEPVAVRFGWQNTPDVNLFNKEGLPATPFRTDDFPMVTKPKRLP